jgi:hypothetical protein
MPRHTLINCVTNGMIVRENHRCAEGYRTAVYRHCTTDLLCGNEPTYIARMDAIIDLVENQPIRALSSVITLAEVLIQPLKVGNQMLEQEYRDILVNSAGISLCQSLSRLPSLLLICVRDIIFAHRMRCMSRRLCGLVVMRF